MPIPYRLKAHSAEKKSYAILDYGPKMYFLLTDNRLPLFSKLPDVHEQILAETFLTEKQEFLVYGMAEQNANNEAYCTLTYYFNGEKATKTFARALKWPSIGRACISSTLYYLYRKHTGNA